MIRDECMCGYPGSLHLKGKCPEGGLPRHPAQDRAELAELERLVSADRADESETGR